MSTVASEADQQYSAELPSSLEVWRDRRMQARRDRARYEPMWRLCQAFYAGRQWVGWSKRDKRVVEMANPTNRVRETVNVLGTYVNTVIGKTTPEEELPRLFQRADSAQDLQFARASNLFLEYLWNECLQAEQRLYEARKLRAIYGISAVMPRFDKQAGPKIGERPLRDGAPVYDPSEARDYVAGMQEQGQTAEFKQAYEGRPCLDVLSPDHLLPPPGIEYERDFPWLLIERPIAISMLKMIYGSKADGLKAQDLAATDAIGLKIMPDPDDPMAGSGRLSDSVMVTTGYEMPNREYPKGRMVVFSQDKLLASKNELPYELDGEYKIGVRFLKWNTVPGRFWPIGVAEPGIGPQMQRNRSRSQYTEIKDRSLGRVYARTGSLTQENLPVGKAMEIVYVKQGHDWPTETTGAGPGAWVKEDIDMNDRDMELAIGLRDVSLGEAPSSATPYSAMALLAEQDDKRIGPIIKNDRLEIAELVKCLLTDVKKYWNFEKQMAIASDDGQLEAFAFNATNLPAVFHVKVGTGAPAPRNQAAEIQKIFDVFDRGVSAAQVLPLSWLYESLQAAKPQPLPPSLPDSEREKAEYENHLMMLGAQIQVSPSDNHQLHINIHRAYQKQIELVPQAAQFLPLLEQHIQEHEMGEAGQMPAPGTTNPSSQGPMGALGGASSPGAPAQPAAGAPPGAFG